MEQKFQVRNFWKSGYALQGFPEIPDYAVPLVTKNCQKSKTEFLIEWKNTEMFNDFSFNSTFDQEIVQVVCQNGSWFKCFFKRNS